MKKLQFGLCLILASMSLFVQAQEFDGYTLYNENGRTTAYLIDKNEDIAHTWNLNTSCNYAIQLTETGNIVRGAISNSLQIQGPAVGGLVEEFNPDGNRVWSFDHSGSDYVSHHDICYMENGNVLLIAWERKTAAELQALGYTGTSVYRYPTHIIEVRQDGNNGRIVWEWHIWDHLIQDVDPSKPNYGVVSEHPELLDINVDVNNNGSGDWFHVNGIDYNEELDLIVFSSRFLSEIFIIDHSTTTEEAASHSGGNSGKGGDFLYRWGNPQNYKTSGSRMIAGPVHDARWIPNDGRPRAGFIQFFNNDGTNGFASTVDAIELPFAADGYNFERTDGQAYGPQIHSFRHNCFDNGTGQSASNTLPNGNVFVALSRKYMYEVDSNDNIVWLYNEGPAKAFRYTCSHPGIQALISEGVIDNTCPTVSNTDIPNASDFRIFPNPSTGKFTIENFNSYNIEDIKIYNQLGELIFISNDEVNLDLTAYPNGVYTVQILLKTKELVTKKVAVSK